MLYADTMQISYLFPKFYETSFLTLSSWMDTKRFQLDANDIETVQFDEIEKNLNVNVA